MWESMSLAERTDGQSASVRESSLDSADGVCSSISGRLAKLNRNDLRVLQVRRP